jgi:plastocyanin
MKKPRYKNNRLIWLDIAVAIATVVLVGWGIWYTLAGQTASNSTACKQAGPVHEITLAGDAFSTNRLTLKRCDTIKFINTGSEEYSLALGEIDRHETYPGFSQQTVRPGEYVQFNAIQSGAHTMHDHLRNKARIDLDIRY